MKIIENIQYDSESENQCCRNNWRGLSMVQKFQGVEKPRVDLPCDPLSVLLFSKHTVVFQVHCVIFGICHLPFHPKRNNTTYRFLYY